MISSVVGFDFAKGPVVSCTIIQPTYLVAIHHWLRQQETARISPVTSTCTARDDPGAKCICFSRTCLACLSAVRGHKATDNLSICLVSPSIQPDFLVAT